jgi:hypothetical protein
MAKFKSAVFSELGNSNVVFGLSHPGIMVSYTKFEVLVIFVIIFGKQKLYY